MPGPAAPQPRSRPGVLPSPPQDVDEKGCLTLNIWTPDMGGARPVLLWFHGGGYQVGSGGWPCYDGGQLSQTADIVVVTANYRLGALGYLYLPELSDEMGEGNLGVLDQMAALEWVHDNIAAFGGDPSAVTLAGQSAGAMGSAIVAATPGRTDLTRRLFLASPPLADMLSPEEGTTLAHAYVEVLGLTPRSLKELRSLPWRQLVAAQGDLSTRLALTGANSPGFGPVQGGAGAPWTPLAAAARGAMRHLDLLAGSTRDEQSFFGPPAGVRDRAGALEAMSPRFGGCAAEAYEFYLRRRPDASPGGVAQAALGFATFERSTLTLLESQIHHGRAGCFLYRFDWQSAARRGSLGAPHTIDLPFLFGNSGIWKDCELMAGADTRVVRALTMSFQGAIGAFVRDGTPNAPDLPAWAPYGLGQRSTMRYDTVTECVGDLSSGQRALQYRP